MRSGPSPVVLTLVGLAVGGLTAVFVIAATGDGGESEPTTTTDPFADDRAALTAYEEKIDPLAEEGGRIVVQGLRPAITNIREGDFTDEELVTMQEGQLQEMRNVWKQFQAVKPPKFLQEAQDLFEKSLDGYVRAAQKLLDAARAGGDERQRLVDEVAPIGDASDDVYDQALEILNRERERLGMEGESRL